jgi:hypothetical protein
MTVPSGGRIPFPSAGCPFSMNGMVLRGSARLEIGNTHLLLVTAVVSTTKGIRIEQTAMMPLNSSCPEPIPPPGNNY